MMNKVLTTLFAIFLLLIVLESLAQESISEPDRSVGLDDFYSNLDMHHLAKEILSVTFRSENYNLLRTDLLPDGYLTRHNLDTAPIIRNRISRIAERSTYPDYPLTYSVDSSLCLSDTLMVISADTFEQYINANISARSKSIAIDREGRFYYLYGFDDKDAVMLANNMLNFRSDLSMCNLLAELIIRKCHLAQPITPEYLSNNVPLSDKFGRLNIRPYQQGDSLAYSIYGDRLLFTESNEPYQSTVVHYQFNYSKQSGFSYTMDTLGVIRYPDSND